MILDLTFASENRNGLLFTSTILHALCDLLYDIVAYCTANVTLTLSAKAFCAIAPRPIHSGTHCRI